MAKDTDDPPMMQWSMNCHSLPNGIPSHDTRIYIIQVKELSINNFPISRSNVVRIQGAARGA
jgi:hypothetical protein